MDKRCLFNVVKTIIIVLKKVSHEVINTGSCITDFYQGHILSPLSGSFNNILKNNSYIIILFHGHINCVYTSNISAYFVSEAVLHAVPLKSICLPLDFFSIPQM